jgi:hypothetical protein
MYVCGTLREPFQQYSPSTPLFPLGGERKKTTIQTGEKKIPKGMFADFLSGVHG